MNTRRTTRSPQHPRRQGTTRRVRGAAVTAALAVGIAGSILGASALAGERPSVRPVAGQIEQPAGERPRAVNRREHLGHADVRTMHHVQDERRSRSACSDRLVQAWTELGHSSDAYETYLLDQPPCD